MAQALITIWSEELKHYLVEVDAEEIAVLKKAHNNFLGGGNLPKDIERAVCSVLAACDPDRQNWRGVPLLPNWLDKTWETGLLDPNKVLVLFKNTALIITGQLP